MKIITISIFLSMLTSCAAMLEPEERIASWPDWELCHRFATYVYAGNSKWLWYVSDEIKARNLTDNEKCKSVYDARIRAHVRKHQTTDLNISFGEAMNTPGLDGAVDKQ